MDSERYFFNEFIIKNPTDKLTDIEEKEILMSIEKFEKIIKEDSRIYDGQTVYIGYSGVLYYYLNCYFTKNDGEIYLNLCSKYVDLLISVIDNKKYFDESELCEDITFLTGIVGPLTLLAIYYDIKDDQKKVEKMLTDIKSLTKYCFLSKSCELLYGKSGYIYASRLLNSYFKREIISSEILKSICYDILKRGERTAREFNRRDIYIWRELNYVFIGAAHGISGILYQLLNFQFILDDENIMKKIQNTANFIIKHQDNEGNFGEINEKMEITCHFCYGAPGIIPTLLKLYTIRKDQKVS